MSTHRREPYVGRRRLKHRHSPGRLSLHAVVAWWIRGAMVRALDRDMRRMERALVRQAQGKPSIEWGEGYQPRRPPSIYEPGDWHFEIRPRDLEYVDPWPVDVAAASVEQSIKAHHQSQWDALLHPAPEPAPPLVRGRT